MEVDYLIIGQGLAGTNLAHTAEKAGKSFLIVDNEKEVTSSKVAAGLINPITGKRAVKTWMADTLFPFAATFYKDLEIQLNTSFYQSKNIYKPFRDIEDQNDILAKTADKKFTNFISLEPDLKDYENVLKHDLGGIEVLQAGNLSTEIYLKASKNYFEAQSNLCVETIKYNDITLFENHVEWKDVVAKRIIFCEGYQAMKNPYFEWLPFQVTKGEILKVNINDLKEEKIINKGAFILPLGNKEFLVGSSYDLTTDESLTEKGKKFVQDKLENIISTPYKVIGHRAAIRPTVRDRRPFIGKHPDFSPLYIFNGMGTKGVILSPFFANELIEHLENNKELNREVNISRYFSLYSRLH